jgi:hypothetical protein
VGIALCTVHVVDATAYVLLPLDWMVHAVPNHVGFGATSDIAIFNSSDYYHSCDGEPLRGWVNWWVWWEMGWVA